MIRLHWSFDHVDKCLNHWPNVQTSYILKKQVNDMDFVHIENIIVRLWGVPAIEQQNLYNQIQRHKF